MPTVERERSEFSALERRIIDAARLAFHNGEPVADAFRELDGIDVDGPKVSANTDMMDRVWTLPRIREHNAGAGVFGSYFYTLYRRRDGREYGPAYAFSVGRMGNVSHYKIEPDQ